MYGNFVVEEPFGLREVNEEMNNFDILELDDEATNNLLSQLQASDFLDMNYGNEMYVLNETLKMPAFDNLPSPETPTRPTQNNENETKNEKMKRFKTKTEEELKKYEELNQAVATQKSTKWGMKILQDWHQESYGTTIEMKTISPEELCEKLGKFYCEARPKDAEKRVSQTMPRPQAEEYHKNTLKSIRSAINRHLSDIGRNIDIVNDSIFKSANKKLGGLLKERMRQGTSRPTQHKDIIPLPDLEKISSYLENAKTCPIILRLAVWYNISIHFVSRGLEFHHQLNLNSFEFLKDPEGKEYARLTHETQQKNYQGGLVNEEAMPDRRMYATNTPSCPVAMLKFFLSKSDPKAKSLFNKINKDGITSPTGIWYNDIPLSKYSFRRFLPNICENAKCTGRYTAHCLRATAIQTLSNAGFETRQIMFMSGHRNEASIRSYSRDFSAAQKHSISATLTNISTGSKETDYAKNVETAVNSDPRDQQISVFPTKTCTVTRPVTVSESNSSFASVLSSVQSGLLTNSSFQQCSFNFNISH